jgi:hypothetical protein
MKLARLAFPMAFALALALTGCTGKGARALAQAPTTAAAEPRSGQVAPASEPDLSDAPRENCVNIGGEPPECR